MVTYPYAYMTYVVSPLAGLGGSISWRPPAYSLLLFITSAKEVMFLSLYVCLLAGNLKKLRKKFDDNFWRDVLCDWQATEDYILVINDRDADLKDFFSIARYGHCGMLLE